MKYLIPYQKENIVSPAPLETAEIRGALGQRIDRFCYERVWGEFALREILGEAEKCFREKYDDVNAWGFWQSEFWGKLMLSGVRICRMKNDEKLKAELNASAHRMLKMQRADGYLSTYRRIDNVFAGDKEIAMREIGWPCVFNWNVWGQKYTLWGLLECALLCDDNELLNGADRLATCLLDTLERLGVRPKDCGVIAGMPPCSILKPMLVLYRLTAKERYLQFALDIAEEWDRDDNECPNLIRNALGDVAPEKWYTKTASGEDWCAKSYEMMSCFDGLCELYRVTGTEKYLNAAKGLYELLIKYESNCLWTVGYFEHFDGGASHPDGATEICDVIHWMRLCFELFTLTGDAKYMDSFETAFVNPLMAGVFEDGKSGAFAVRSAGRHYMAGAQVGTKYQHCCLNNLPRGFANAAEAAVMKSRDAYYVNAYYPCVAAFGAVDFRVSSEYFTEGKATVTVRRLPGEQKVCFRIPAWSRETVIICGETKMFGKPGTFAELMLPAGDSVIYLTFDMTPHIVDNPAPYVALPDDDYHVSRWCDSVCDRGAMVKQSMSTVRCGALLYARSKRIGCKEEEMFSGKTVHGGHYTCTAQNLTGYSVLALKDFTFTNGTETFTYRMCDYASAANFITQDGRYFNVQI